MRYALLSLTLLVGVANAETFRCQSGNYWLDSGTVVVVATINEDGHSGTIKVAGVTHQAYYSVAGFDRRWNFGKDADGAFNYSFAISPTGIARYYDFSSVEWGEPAKNSQTFICK